MSVALFSMAKMESNYVEEWAKYHLALGFDRIYLYDNEDKPTYSKILQKYKNNITVIPFPGVAKKGGMQNICIFHFTINFLKKHEYVMHIDLDEFVCLKKHSNIKDFINHFFIDKTLAAIAFNWVFFGSNGHIDYTNQPVTQRFTKCQEGSDKHIKLLVKTQYFKRYHGCHVIFSIDGTFTKDTKGKIVEGTFNEDGDIEYCQINHYKTKSVNEFKKSLTRPRPDKTLYDPDRYRNSFDIEYPLYNKNDIEELTVQKFYQNLTPN